MSPIVTWGQVDVNPPSDDFLNDHRQKASGVYDYKLYRNRVYFGFFSHKDFNKINRYDLEREAGTAIGYYGCFQDSQNEAIVKVHTERFDYLKYEYTKLKNDCDRRLKRIEFYNAKFNKRVIVKLTKNYQDLNAKTFRLDKQIEDDGIFIRAIFDRSNLTGNPEVHSLTKDGFNYKKYYLGYHFEDRPAEAPFYDRVFGEHYVSMLDMGVAALKVRLDMIKRAKRSIDFMTYIYEPDNAGRIFTQALAQKVKEGVRVRVLIDRAPFDFIMKKKFTSAMQKAGIEVKLHNDNFFKINPWQVRNHQKMLIVDDKEMITGGRNLADAYFGLHPKKNYLDRDVWVAGPVAKNAKWAFEKFWTNDLCEEPKFTKKYDKNFLIENDNDRTVIEQVQKIGDQQLNLVPVVKTKSATFVSDRPGSNDDYTRIVSHVIYNILRKNQNKQVMIEAPYFLMLKEGKQVLAEMLSKGVDMSVITNSRYSIGNHHVPMAYVLEKLNKYNVRNGIDIYGYSGVKLPDEELVVDLDYEAQTEIHGKSMVLGDDVFIGTYNLDPRSKYFNVELGLFFENEPDLAALMNWSYSRILLYSLKMDVDGKYEQNYFLDLIREKRSKLVDRDWLAFKGVVMRLVAKNWL